jgi:hypothetical protein
MEEMDLYCSLKLALNCVPSEKVRVSLIPKSTPISHFFEVRGTVGAREFSGIRKGIDSFFGKTKEEIFFCNLFTNFLITGDRTTL